MERLRRRALLEELRQTDLFDKLLKEKAARVIALHEQLHALGEEDAELRSELALLAQESDVQRVLGDAAQEAVRALPSFAEFRLLKGSKRIRDLSAGALPASARREQFAAAARQLRREVCEVRELEGALARSAEGQQRLQTNCVRLDETSRVQVRNKLSYFEFLMTCMELNTLPENVQKLNALQYCVENNLPVEKQLLYEVCPEMFSYEIEDMDEVARRKATENAVRLDFAPDGELAGAGFALHAGGADEAMLAEHLKRRHKMMRLLEKRVDAGQEQVLPYLQRHFRDERKLSDFLDLLMERAPESLAEPEERAIFETIAAGRALLEDIVLAEQKFLEDYHALQKQIQMPFFVRRHARLRECWLRKHAESMVDMEVSESVLLPRAEPTPDFISQEMSPAERKTLQWSTAVSPGPIAEQLRDHSSAEKAEERVLRAQVMGDVLNRIADDVKGDRIQLDADYGYEPIEEEGGAPELAFRAGRVSFEELTRCLYLNNEDPRKYSLAFFADYFDVPLQDLKEVFDALAFPVVLNSRMVKVYRFFSDID